MANNRGVMYQGYWYPSNQNNNWSGYSPRNNVWGYRNFNNNSDPRYYSRDWRNCNFQGMGTPQSGSYNQNNIYWIYNSSDGRYYPVYNTNMKHVKKGKRRMYRRG